MGTSNFEGQNHFYPSHAQRVSYLFLRRDVAPLSLLMFERHNYPVLIINVGRPRQLSEVQRTRPFLFARKSCVRRTTRFETTIAFYLLYQASYCR